MQDERSMVDVKSKENQKKKNKSKKEKEIKNHTVYKTNAPMKYHVIQ